MYRIKKVKRGNKEQYFPQIKGTFGWVNVHYDFHFEEFKLAKNFLEELVKIQMDTIEQSFVPDPQDKEN